MFCEWINALKIFNRSGTRHVLKLLVDLDVCFDTQLSTPSHFARGGEWIEMIPIAPSSATFWNESWWL
jgi:hypothetical protein